MYVSSNTLSSQRKEIMGTLGVKEVDRFESYLGLPTLIGRAKYQAFSYLKGRVWKKLQGWKGMLLSRARKEILIKSSGLVYSHLHNGCVPTTYEIV